MDQKHKQSRRPISPRLGQKLKSGPLGPYGFYQDPRAGKQRIFGPSPGFKGEVLLCISVQVTKLQIEFCSCENANYDFVSI